MLPSHRPRARGGNLTGLEVAHIFSITGVGKIKIDRFGQMGTNMWVSVRQLSGSLMSVIRKVGQNLNALMPEFKAGHLLKLP